MHRGRSRTTKRYVHVGGVGTLVGVLLPMLVAAGCGDDDATTGGGGADEGADGSVVGDGGGRDAARVVDAGPDVVDASAADANEDAEPGDAGPDVREGANIAFATSRTVRGDFGGLGAGDAICNEEAADAGLPGTYVAYLSTSTVDAIDRIAGSRGWVRPDGKPFADRPEDIAEGRIIYPLVRTARNVEAFAFGHHFTGSNVMGRKAIGRTCDDWTSTTGDASGGSFGSSIAFSGGTGVRCADPPWLACLGVGKTFALPAPPQTQGRLAFVTKGDFTPGGGLAAADALCQAEATAAGRTGTFRALLAADGATAASRFSTAGLPWVRADGLALAETAEAFLTKPQYDLPILYSADGLTRFDSSRDYWRGAPAPFTPGTSESTCASWTTTTGNGTGGWGVDRVGWGNVPTPCDQPLGLVCLQE